MMWKKLSLLKEEDSEYSKRTIAMIGGKAITAKSFTQRVLNMEAIARTFKQLWQTKKGFEVKDMGNHVVLFVFQMDRMQIGSYWESHGVMTNI